MSSSFDPFDIRMQLLSHLKKLNASQQSIQKVVNLTIKYGSRCGEDLWDCIIEECEKGTLNVRINVLFLLDSLCETSLYVGLPDAPYVDYVTRDLAKIVELVVPESREGVLNLLSAKQILESWRTKRVINPDLVDQVLETLEQRKATVHVASSNSRKRAHYENFSHADTLRRMEEDRERQKRLRERIWILPIPHLLPSSSNASSSRRQSGSHSSRFPSTPSTDPSPESPFTPASPFTPKTPREMALNSSGSGKDKGERERAREREKVGVMVMESALDIEFEQVWETTSELNEDDLREMEEENTACFDPPIRPETWIDEDESTTKPPSPPTPLLPTPLPSHSSRNPATISASASSSKLSSPKIAPSAPSSFEKNASRPPPPSHLSNEISRTHSAPPIHSHAPPSAPSNPYARPSQPLHQQRPPLPSPNPTQSSFASPLPPPPTLNPTQNYGFPPPPAPPLPPPPRNPSQHHAHAQPNYSIPPPTLPPPSSTPYPSYPPPPTLFQQPPPPTTLPLQSWQTSPPAYPPPPHLALQQQAGFPPPPLPPHMLPPQQQQGVYDPSYPPPPFPPPPPTMAPPPGTPTGPGSYSRGYERGGGGFGGGQGGGYQRGRGR